MKQLVAILVLLIGCGGDDPKPVERSGALCDLYRVACARQAECGVFLYNRTTDAVKCEEQLACEDVVEGFAAADVAISETDAKACRDKVAAASCEGLVLWDGDVSSALVAVEPSCVAVFQGTREQGESCSWPQQCKPGLECGGDTCPGTCEEIAERCTVGGCADSEFCDSNGECKPRAQLGGDCFPEAFENVCEDNSFCDLDGADGTCKPLLARGDACSLASFFSCANGDICRNGTCDAPTPPGGDCSSSDECGLGSFCAFQSGSVCSAYLTLGSACTNAQFECGPNAQCDDGQCVPAHEDLPTVPTETHAFVGAGENCELANCAAGLACRPTNDVWLCETAPRLGESCRPDNQADELAVMFSGTAGIGGCAEGICDMFGTWTCVVPALPGAACDAPGISASCASAICQADHTCADFFEDCPQ